MNIIFTCKKCFNFCPCRYIGSIIPNYTNRKDGCCISWQSVVSFFFFFYFSLQRCCHNLIRKLWNQLYRRIYNFQCSWFHGLCSSNDSVRPTSLPKVKGILFWNINILTKFYCFSLIIVTLTNFCKSRKYCLVYPLAPSIVVRHESPGIMHIRNRWIVSRENSSVSSMYHDPTCSQMIHAIIEWKWHSKGNEPEGHKDRMAFHPGVTFKRNGS